MKKLLERIHRKTKVLLNLVGTALALLVLYVLFSCPTFSVEQQYRRQEKAYLLGPAEILGKAAVEINMSGYDGLLLAEDEKGVILYTYDPDIWWTSHGSITYREKTEDITVVAGPAPKHALTKDFIFHLPLVVFDDYPDAAYAEMDLELSVTHNQKLFQKSYTLNAVRKGEGYFLFQIPFTEENNPKRTDAEAAALKMLAEVAGNGTDYMDVTVPVTVRLYDEVGNLIVRKDISLQSVAAEAHQKRGTVQE